MFNAGRFLNPNHQSNQSPNNNADNWNNLDNVPFVGQNSSQPSESLSGETTPATAEAPVPSRQQRKIIAYFQTGDLDIIGQHDVSISPADEREFLERLSNNLISNRQQKDFLFNIQSPMNEPGGIGRAAKALNTNYQESKILNFVCNEKFSMSLTPEQDLAHFYDNFPTPLDFEPISAAFLQRIAANNPKEKVAEYKKSMRQFKYNVYGKKQEYWEQLLALREKAAHLPSNHEQTKNHEKDLILDFGVAEMSKAETRGDIFNDKPSQDAHFEDPEHGVFAVFDGAGGHIGGFEASHSCKNALAELSASSIVEKPEDLRPIMDKINEAVVNNPDAGFSTGTVIKISASPDGQKQLFYASVGDSRLYLIRDGAARQLTKDEGEGNYIYNAFGQVYHLHQIGAEPLRHGDCLMLCSDGVTGDYGDEIMSPEVIYDIIANSENLRQSARQLTSNARKKDDRTAIVLQV